MKFSVIKVDNPLWNELVEKCHTYDFHHTSCFHRVECFQEEATLFVAENNEADFIALPLIIRKISKTNLLDATSIYGYGGPIASKSFDVIPEEFIIFFKESFINYCISNNIISVFSRLHPLINTEEFFNNFGKIIHLNKTVAIDLTLSLAEQRKHYRKSNKSEINQLKKKKGYTIKLISSDDKDDIKEFVDIYHQNMDRVNAKEYYYFDVAYFENLLNNNCFNSSLLVAYKDDKMTAGAIFTETKEIMQYHLAGTKDEYISDTPMKLILDEARLLGTEKKLKFLHLGGGVGGSDEDSLFRFKRGFSKNFFQFNVWNLVVNEKIYQSLVQEKGIKAEDFPNFFPLYRAVRV